MNLDPIFYGADESDIENALNDLQSLGPNSVKVTRKIFGNSANLSCFQYNITFNADFCKSY
jgi:hypothetical protein